VAGTGTAGTELIRDFVNTRDLLDGIEELDAPPALTAWLGARGLGEVSAGSPELEHALELREALRRLLLANTGLQVDTDAGFAILDGAARRARIELRFEHGEAALLPAAEGADAALGRIVIAVHEAMADGSWERLKACRASECEWAFIDGARNHSRAWCSMRSCGNREKARAFRERHRPASG
jgi:predicted RNA-binding Zn ribbon-like protein